MKKPVLGIHERCGSFSDRWIEYCRERDILFRIIDAFSSDLMDQAKCLKAFLWHWPYDDYAPQLVARQILRSLEIVGLIVFPNTDTCWHYDDKLAQKYLLEAVAAPLAPTWVFYRLQDAMDWLAGATFPKVFKLRRGASSDNVRLVTSRKEATRLCKVAFTRGFDGVPSYFGDFTRKVRQVRSRGGLGAKLMRAPGVLHTLHKRRRLVPPERQYVYFQEYMARNAYDTRVTVIGERAFAYHRRNRPGDFRASGSGCIDHKPESIDLNVVKEAFRVARGTASQSLAMDFVYDAEHRPTLLEISYAFVSGLVTDCPGHWDESLTWHPGHVHPADAILEDVLAQLDNNRG